MATIPETLTSEHLLPYEKAREPDPVEGLEGFVEAAAEAGVKREAEDAPEIEGAAEDAADDRDEDDDDADDSDDDDEADDQPRYKVRANGEEIEVPLDELLRGYSRQVDYTRKTSEVARMREAVQREKGQVAEKLMMMSRVAERLSPQDREIMAQEWEAERAEYETISQELRQEYLAEQSRLLQEAIPEWAQEPEKATAEKRALAEYAENVVGLTREEIANAADHRMIVTLRKAMKYDELMGAGKEALRSKVATAPVMKPGGRPNHQAGGAPSRRQAAEIKRAAQRLERSGSVTDAAALFEHIDL